MRIVFVAVLMLAGIVKAPGTSPNNIPVIRFGPQTVEELIIKESWARGISPALPLAVAWRESNYIPTKVHCCNDDGSRDWGVMQLNDSTIYLLHVKHPLDRVENIKVGVGIIASYLREGRGEKWAMCAYGSGPQRCGTGLVPASASR